MLLQSRCGLNKTRLLSPEGKCFAFDERASGFGKGEGAGCVVLKPLEHALLAGDSIRAVIRNTGVNQDGRTPGITMPNRDSQEVLIRSVYSAACLVTSDTAYVETHGTGTSAGDSTEASALGAIFGHHEATKIRDPVYIGSLKSNTGHLEGASGVVYPQLFKMTAISHSLMRYLTNRIDRLLVLSKQP